MTMIVDGKTYSLEGNVVPVEEFDRARRKAPRLRRTGTDTIMDKDFEPIRWIVEGYLPEGFSVLAGRQKLGKTWMAIDIALAVACGGLALGAIGVDQGDVLYIDRENGERRIQRRIATIYPSPKHRPGLSRLEWVTECPDLDKGLIAALDDWRTSVEAPRLVVIDVLQRIKPAGNAARNAYENDYSIWSPLQSWATEHGIGVLGLHHTKKGGADDPLEALSGSNGLSACADTTLVLDRTGEGITLYVRGRDVDEKESALLFNGGLWTITGDAAAVRITTERRQILDALLEAGDEALNPQQISAAANMKRNNVDRLLGKMVRDREVVKVERGKYRHPLGTSGKKVGNEAEPRKHRGLSDE
ncbi:MAG: AAA family ATPase [Devosia sp.]